jgi:hypothetical protein
MGQQDSGNGRLRFSGRAHAVTEGKPINLRLLGTGAVASKPASIN